MIPGEKTAVEIAADALPHKTERKFSPIVEDLVRPKTLIERLVLNQSSAWRELDSIPVPQTTFYDKNGLPAYTVLANGERLYPAGSSLGALRQGEDATQVGENLRPAVVEGEVVWSGAIPDEWRHAELRSAEQEKAIAEGYDEASESIHSPEEVLKRGIRSGWDPEEAPGTRRRVQRKAQRDREERERNAA